MQNYDGILFIFTMFNVELIEKNVPIDLMRTS